MHQIEDTLKKTITSTYIRNSYWSSRYVTSTSRLTEKKIRLKFLINIVACIIFFTYSLFPNACWYSSTTTTNQLWHYQPKLFDVKYDNLGTLLKTYFKRLIIRIYRLHAKSPYFVYLSGRRFQKSWTKTWTKIKSKIISLVYGH